MDSIKELIAKMPVSIAKLARDASVSQPTVQSMLAGRRVRRDKAINVLDALTIIYKREDNPFTLDNVTDINI